MFIFSDVFEANVEKWIPFPQLTKNYSLGNLADLSELNRQSTFQRIISKDGHFFYENGTRVRFFGTNVCYGHAFPYKSDAPFAARRLAQLGINVLRLCKKIAWYFQ